MRSEPLKTEKNSLKSIKLNFERPRKSSKMSLKKFFGETRKQPSHIFEAVC